MQHSIIPQDLICLMCRKIGISSFNTVDSISQGYSQPEPVNDPYRLPCKHSLCIYPCITTDDNSEFVRCPLCNLSCNLADIVPDTDRRDRAKAFLAQQRIQAQQPEAQHAAVDLLEANITSTSPMLAQCQACSQMVFGLEYYPCFGKAICARCRDKQLGLLSVEHIKKILKLKELEKHLDGIAEKLRAKRFSPESSPISLQLDSAVAVVFNKLTESIEKAEKVIEVQNRTTENTLIEINKNTEQVLPGIIETPVMVEQLYEKGAKYKEWHDLKEKIHKNSKLTGQFNEELIRLGTETCILNEEGINQIRRQLENFAFVTDGGRTNEHYDQPSLGAASSNEHRSYAMEPGNNDIESLFA
ncbi:hypothetical protein Aperf_G00000025810 [Anoplocephala perfoliata]